MASTRNPFRRPSRATRPTRSSRTGRLGIERLEDRLAPAIGLGFAVGIGGTGSDAAVAVAADAAGNSYVAGYFSGTVDFDSTPEGEYSLVSAGEHDVFVAKYDPDGGLLWARRAGGGASDQGRAIAVDDRGDVYVAGNFSSPSAIFGNQLLTNAGLSDAFVMKLTGDGTFLWTDRVGGTGSDSASGIAVDAARNVHVVGNFNGTVDFNPDTSQTANLTSQGRFSDVFVLKLGTSGGYTWARSFNSSANDFGDDIAVDASGNVYTTGRYSAAANDFDPGPGTARLPYAGTQSNIFLSKLDASGNFVWANGFVSTENILGTALAVDAAGNAYLTGYYSGTIDFDPASDATFNLTAMGADPIATDIFVAKFNAAGGLAWAKSVGGPFQLDWSRGIALDAAGNVYFAGNYTIMGDFDPDPAGTYNLVGMVTDQVASVDNFVAKLDNDGRFVWARGFDSIGPIFGANLGSGLAVDGRGRVYVSGYFGGTVDFDPHPTSVSGITPKGSADGFLVQLTQTVSTGSLTLTPAADGHAIDSNLDGTFDSIDTTGQTISTENYYDQRWIGLIEYDLTGIDPSSQVLSATLTLDVVSFQYNSLSRGVDIEIFAYAGDGTLRPADGAAPAIFAGRATNIELGTLSVSLDPAVLRSLLAGGFAGFAIRLARGEGFSVASSELSYYQPPRLTLTVGVPSTNISPLARDDAYLSSEDTTLTVPASAGLLNNDEDANGDSLTATLITGPATGILSLNADGSFTYTPPAEFSGIVSFTYLVGDGTGYGNLARVTLLIEPVNDPPVAFGESYSLNEGNPLFPEPSPNLLANDTDIDSDPSTFTTVQITNASHGDVIVNSDGTFYYFPDTNFAGTDSFTYAVRDGQGGQSQPVTVTLIVNPVNDAPEFSLSPSGVTIVEDAGAQSITGFASRISPGPESAVDEANQALNFVLTVTGTTGGLTFTQAPAIGLDGRLTFTAAPNSSGTATVWVVLVDDGGTANGGVDRSSTHAFTIVVNSINDAPTNIVPGPRTINEDQAVGLVVQVSDVDAGSSPLVVTLSLPAGAGRLDVTSFPGATVSGNGTGSLQVRGTLGQINETLAGLVFTPTVDFNSTIAGGPVLLTVVTSDQGNFGNGGAKTDTDTVAITILPVNDAPRFVLASTTVPALENAGQQAIAGFASQIAPGPANAADEIGQALSFEVTVIASNGLGFAQAPTIGLDGTLRFTAAPGSFGSATVSVALIDDGGTANGGVDRLIRTFVITVGEVNDAPTAVADSFATDEDTTLIIPTPGVLANDSDADGDFLTAVLVADPSHGSLELNPDGTFRYVPAPGFSGTDSFTYRPWDGTTLGNLATVTIDVTPVNDAPTIVSLAVTPGSPAVGDPLVLTAGGVGDVDGTVTRVDFYRESNGIAGLQVGGDTLVGSDASADGGWSAAVTTAGLAPGSHTFYATAVDDQGATSPADAGAPFAVVTLRAAAEGPAFGDGGFESPAVAPGSYWASLIYDPAGSPWAFTPESDGHGSGLAADGGGFTHANPGAPEGHQVAFLQGQGSIGQLVGGWAAGDYAIEFLAAQRGDSQSAYQELEVLIDGVVVDTIRPLDASYRRHTTARFRVAAGSHAITLRGLNGAGGNNTALIDDVRVVRLPGGAS